ncbi:MAG: hypothetical protein CFK52_10490 [Chloracidobacterium sp. CP2_5A]|nr:MAG: hypothetical protein CFK52_10490 [Chloracidobacterium sp. CP2_5A]
MTTAGDVQLRVQLGVQLGKGAGDMEGVAILGSLLFLLILVVSCGSEFYELYQGRRELEDGNQPGSYLLFPRRYYVDLHRRNYSGDRGDAPLAGNLERTFLVKRAELPARCEVCHQDDRFEPQAGYCARCDYYTL